jgi:hypothetical protein
MRGCRLVAITVVAVVLGGCASSNAQLSGSANRSPATDSPAEALSLWNDFPADSSPRPLVLAGPTIIYPASGFRNDDDKLAFMAGRFAVATALPSGSSTWQQQPLITADQALADLRNGAPGTPQTSAALTVTAARLSTATFSTDRGRRSLPAWQFSFAGVHDPASVLAIAAANRWPKAPRASDDSEDLGARIAPGGATITITFFGAAAGTGLCEAQYQADAAQSSSAVVITVRELPRASSQPASSDGVAIGCAAIGYPREVTIKLSPALGGRVLIDSHGVPLPAG